MHEDLTRDIIGAFYQVYRELGYGFFEAVYQRAMPLALAARGVTFRRLLLSSPQEGSAVIRPSSA